MSAGLAGRARVETVAIVGAGLIGASVALALRRAGAAGRIVAYDPDPAVRDALVPGIADLAASSIEQAVSEADLVFVACPVGSMGEVFEAIALRARDDCLVTDCGSTKRSVIEAANRAFGEGSRRFVAGHPIAGSERSGPSAARAELFRGRPWLLCPVGAEQRARAEELGAYLSATGAVVECVDAARHDAMFAEFSHWPHAVAFALCASIARGEHAHEAGRFSGAGLRDTTRIGASSATLWAGILLDNAGPLLESARRFRESLDALERAVAAGDRQALEAMLEAGSRWRKTVG